MFEETDMGEPVRRRQFTVADYHRMGEAGIFETGARVELVGGEVVEMSPIGSRHAGCVNKLTKLLIGLCGDRAVVQVQNPIRLDDYSEPQPDISLLRPRDDFYSSATPLPSSTLLAIEVADSSLAFDRKVKAPLYASTGVPELWIVDLETDAIEIYSGASAHGYAMIRRALRGESLVVPIDGRPTCGVDQILP